MSLENFVFYGEVVIAFFSRRNYNYSPCFPLELMELVRVKRGKIGQKVGLGIISSFQQRELMKNCVNKFFYLP